MRPKFRIPAESWVLYSVLLVLCLLQRPGQVTTDTRLELAQRPGSFLAGSFQLWHPETNFGEIQNQAYGYLFPQGAWFTLMDWVGLPTWLSQRFWMALVLLVAVEGTRRVALVVGLGRGAAFLAGLAFAFAPRFLSTLGVLSAETLVGAVMPWVLLPVLLVVKGWMRPWRGAVLSAAAVVCMGGVNAVEVLGSLPLPLVVVVWSAVVGLTAWRFVLQWCGMVALAGLWWMLPLLVLGKYSPAFYAWVESSAITTGLIGPEKALRGATHWVGLLRTGNDPWWPAASALNFTDHLVVVAALVQVLGLVGLALWSNRLRVPFLLAALVAFAALTISHGTWAGSPAATTMTALLDGPIQMFRNVHKIDPTLRLPIAIGFGYLCARAVHAAAAWLGERWPRRLRAEQGSFGWLLFAVPLLVVATLGQPLLADQTRIRGWSEFDRAWTQAHDYLVAEQQDTRTLVVPGSGFAQQTWGWTLDEPLLGWSDVNFATRSMVPLAPGTTIRFLTALNTALVRGSAGPELVQVLQRAGIGHILVRRDLDSSLTRTPDPRGAARSARNMGLVRVAEYGPRMQGGRQVEIYAVRDASSGIHADRTDGTLTVSGSVEGVVDLRDAGLLDGETSVVLAGEENWTAPTDVVTDTNTRRERAFGSVEDNLSAVMQADEEYRVARTTHDYPGSPSPEVVAEYDGVRLVSASSSVAYADTWGTIDPGAGPYAVLDGDSRTRWVSSPGQKATDQWLRIDFEAPRKVHRVRVDAVVGDGGLGQPRQLQVRAGSRTRLVDVDPTGSPSRVDLGGIRTDHLEISFTRVSGAERAQVGVADVRVSGLDPIRSLRLPEPVADNAQVMLSTDPGTAACQPDGDGVRCDETRTTRPTELTGMRRKVTWQGATDQVVQGQVVPRATRQTQNLVRTRGSGQLTAASSVLGEDLLAAPVFATDGDDATSWHPATTDAQPTFTVMWNKPRRIEGVSVTYADGVSRLPYMQVLVDGKPRKGFFQGNAFRFAKPFRGTTITLRFNRSDGADFAVSEIGAVGFDMVRRIDRDASITQPCGAGPFVQVDRALLATRVEGTVRDLLSGRPLDFQVCGQVSKGVARATGKDLKSWLVGQDTAATTLAVPTLEEDGGERRASDAWLSGTRFRPAVDLSAGEHVVSATPSAEFVVTRLVMTPTDLARGHQTMRGTRVVRASTSRRTVEVAAGEQALLVMPENHNIGWWARGAGNTSLQPVRVDGWMQGWLVPASEKAQTVQVTFLAERSFAQAMAFSVLAAGGVLLLGVVALLVPRWQRRRYGRMEAWPENEDTPGVELAVDELSTPPWRRSEVMALLAGVALGIGPLTAAVAVLGWRNRRTTVRALAVVAGLLGVGSAVVVLPGWDLPEVLADALAASAVGLVVAMVLRALRPHPRGVDRPLLANWRGVQGWLAAGLLVGSAAWRWVLTRDSFFGPGELPVTADARGRALDLDHLLEPINGHLAIGQRAVHWLFAEYAPFDWVMVAAFIVVLQTVALWAAWALLSRLLPGRWVRLVLFAALALSSAGLLSSLSWTAAMSTWPVVIALCAALACQFRLGTGDGSRVWNTLGLLAALGWGLLWSERALFIVVPVLGMAVLTEPRSGWRRPLRAARRWWWVWGALALACGGYLVQLQHTSSVFPLPWVAARDFLTAMGEFIWRGVAPYFFSGPWDAVVGNGQVAVADWAAVTSAVLLLLSVVALWWVDGPRTRWAVLCWLGYVALHVGATTAGRGELADLAVAAPAFTYELVCVGILLAAVVLSSGEPRRHAAVAAERVWTRRVAVFVLVGAQVAGSVVSARLLAPARQNTEQRTFVETAELASVFNPSLVHLDRPAPRSVAGDVTDERAMLSRVLDQLPGWPAFDLPTPGLAVFNDQGQPKYFEFDPVGDQMVRGEEIPPEERRADRQRAARKPATRPRPKVLVNYGCWASLGPSTTLSWRLDAPVLEAQDLLLAYRAAPGADVEVDVGGRRETFRTSQWGQVHLPGREQDVDTVRVRTPADLNGEFCIVLMRVGRLDEPVE